MRYLQNFIEKDLQKKMVFVSGPRQCGKTTLAEALLHKTSGSLENYFNWDLAKSKQDILQGRWTPEQRLVVLDEIHKYPRWKNWIKGFYDTQKNEHSFLVTGSARLDVFRRGGDSLLGRYHHWRLHPFCLNEAPKKMREEEIFKRLMTVGGFPEPFLDGDEMEANRWRRERNDGVIYNDLRDLENVRDISNISLLLELLKTRVGGLIVVNNLAQDLQVSHKAVQKWIEILERLYLIFVVRPFTKNLDRALQKPFKVYFYDTGDVIGDEGVRFENLVATHLLKRIHFWEDISGQRFVLNFVRDREGREVDFVVVKNNVPIQLMECKWSDDKSVQALIYMAQRLKPKEAILAVARLKRSYREKNLKIVKAVDILKTSYAKTEIP